MPYPGLSLVGFMDQSDALAHMKNACIPANPADAALIAEWQAAKLKLGGAVARAGLPDILDLPLSHQARVQQTLSLPWVMAALSGLTVQIKLVEIDPLLAFQFTVNTARANHHCGRLTQPPSLDELLDTCLPLSAPDEPYDWQLQPQSLILKSRSLNLVTVGKGIFGQGQQLAGIIFQPTLPLVHVVRHQGRCYLHNGFHRAFGCRIAGATHVPCLFRDVATPDEVGIRADGGTFKFDLLTSTNPPTVAHFTQAKAHTVTLRELTRVIHVSWSEYTLSND